MNELSLLYQDPEVIYPRAINTLRANPEWFIQDHLLGYIPSIRTTINVLRRQLDPEEGIWGVFGYKAHMYTTGRSIGNTVELGGFRPDPPWFSEGPYAQELIRTGALMRSVNLTAHNKAIPLATSQEHLLFYFLAGAERAFVSYQQLMNNCDLGLYQGNMDTVLRNFQHMLESDASCPLTIERSRGYGVRLVVKGG